MNYQLNPKRESQSTTYFLCVKELIMRIGKESVSNKKFKKKNI